MLDVLKAGQDRLETILAGVKPDQLGKSSPSYKVSDLINHIVGGQFMFAAVATGQSMDPNQAPPDFAAGDFKAAYKQGADAALKGFSAPDAMGKIMHFPFEGMPDMPGAQALGVVLTEVFVHGWDLAKATGQNPEIDPQIAGALLIGAEQNSDGIDNARKMGFFGPEVVVEAGASPTDKLVALLGRQP